MTKKIILEYEKFGITRENLLEIAKEVSFKMKKLKELTDEFGIYLSNKNLSEIIGKIFEKETADFLSNETEYEVINAKSDKDPDLCFMKNGVSVKYVEIKVTSTYNTWTGGEFSQRPYAYLLISWGNNCNEFFIAFTRLMKDDWESRMKKGQRYYGPPFPVRKLNEKSEKIILMGRINERGTRVIREDLLQEKLM